MPEPDLWNKLGMKLFQPLLIEPAKTRSGQPAPVLYDVFDRNAASGAASGIELAIVIPTFDEIDNIEPLLARLEGALDGIEWEAVFVDDDSPDGTAAFIRRLAQTDRRIRCVQRIGRRGLSTAVIEGMLATSAPYLAVIDADMQHDERLLPRMLEKLKSEALDLVIASRYAVSGGIGDWDRRRAKLSFFATRAFPA